MINERGFILGGWEVGRGSTDFSILKLVSATMQATCLNRIGRVIPHSSPQKLHCMIPSEATGAIFTDDDIIGDLCLFTHLPSSFPTGVYNV